MRLHGPLYKLRAAERGLLCRMVAQRGVGAVALILAARRDVIDQACRAHPIPEAEASRLGRMLGRLTNEAWPLPPPAHPTEPAARPRRG